jgi:23S rRNA (guanosine2251-2'-O)-methyltransferase
MVKEKRTGKGRESGARPARRKGRTGTRGGRRYWLYGRHAVAAALANEARRVHRVRLVEPDELALSWVAVEVSDTDSLEALLPVGAVHQGIAAEVSPLADLDLADFIAAESGAQSTRLVILDQVSDPRNVGAIMRTAAAFGVAAIVLPQRHSPPESGALAKAASGALEKVPLIRVANLARALEQLKAAGFWCYGLDADAERELAEVELAPKAALILGGEGHGLRRLTREHCDVVLRVAMAPGSESLNVAATAAITLHAAFASA